MSDPTQTPAGKKPAWHWQPNGPVEMSPLFEWPLKPQKILSYLRRQWLGPTSRVLFIPLVLMSWWWFHPSIEETQTFAWGWVGEIVLRNLLLVTCIAGSLHLYFHVWKKQGMERRFDARPLGRNQKQYTFNDQVKDNIFWTYVGVLFWSGYESLYWWCAANGYAPTLDAAENPVWFIALFFLIPLWSSFHFYWVHRLLHRNRTLYRLGHSLHHRNVNVGPWSGISNHPIEHIGYFSTIMLHWLVASHPLHVLYHMIYHACSPAFSHSGYESVMREGESKLPTGDFFHQLHHRYFECNYGTSEMPWDRWFGSFHDGSEEDTRRIQAEIRARTVANLKAKKAAGE